MFTPGLPDISATGRPDYDSLVLEAKQFLSMRGKTSEADIEAVAKHADIIEYFNNKIIDDKCGLAALFLVKHFVELFE